MKLKCIITDDEPFARKGLQGYIEQVDFLEVAGLCEDAIQLNSMLRREKPHVLFLDIEMPYMTGVEFLRQVSDPPMVVFTTAYEKYAIDGFDLNVIDYLLKPISFDRFLKCANKCFDYFNMKSESHRADYIFVKSNHRLEKISFDSILFIEGMENYVIIQLTDRKFIANVTLKMMTESLPPESFVQTHRSFIVSMKHINSIEGNLLHIEKHRVPVSKALRDEVMAKILNNRLLKRP